jgi:transposase-like protein
MYKTGFIVTFTLLAAMGCGSSATRATAALDDIELAANDRYDAIVDDALDGYEQELREDARATYSSRGAAIAHARAMGHEARLLFHMRRALEDRGLHVQDLCAFVQAHPGFADRQRELRGPQLDRIEALAAAIAHAPLDSEPGTEGAQALAADPTIDRNARAMGGER